jgi:hypothetical protein
MGSKNGRCMRKLVLVVGVSGRFVKDGEVRRRYGSCEIVVILISSSRKVGSNLS